ncbi:MAG: hypothetical protein ACOYXT_30275 [Bacteroidota bacterium]
MKNEEIDRLIQHSQSPSISVIIPLDATDKKTNYETLKKSLQKAKALLKNRAIEEGVKNKINIKLDTVLTYIPERFSNGLGVFISPTQSAIIPLPFKVKLKVAVNDCFETRDLLYLKQYSSPYFVLNLSKKGVHLYYGTMDEFMEVKDGKFPLPYADQFEYERASIANSSSSALKSFERDKNEISEIRLKATFSEADVFVKHHLSNDVKLLLAGTQKMIALFNSVTTLKSQIAGIISGSYSESNFNKLCESTWRTIIRVRNREIARQIEEMKEKRNGHLAEGVQEAWTAATEGKGLLLMVEKDLHHRAYRKETGNKLHLHPPKKPYGIIPDAVDDLIKIVRKKKGKVVLTDNDQLKAFDHLALQLRY